MTYLWVEIAETLFRLNVEKVVNECEWSFKTFCLEIIR